MDDEEEDDDDDNGKLLPTAHGLNAALLHCLLPCLFLSLLIFIFTFLPILYIYILKKNMN